MDPIVRVLLYAQDFAEKFIFFPRAGLLAEQCNMQKVLSEAFFYMHNALEFNQQN